MTYFARYINESHQGNPFMLIEKQESFKLLPYNISDYMSVKNFKNIKYDSAKILSLCVVCPAYLIKQLTTLTLIYDILPLSKTDMSNVNKFSCNSQLTFI